MGQLSMIEAQSTRKEPPLHTQIHEHAPLADRRNKIVTAAEAARLVHDGDTVATGGFVGIGFAEEIAVALETRFLATQAETTSGSPRDLTLVYAAGQGDGKNRGPNHICPAGPGEGGGG